MKNTSFKDSLKFTKTRQAHQSELAEDYVEAILGLINRNGHARLLEIAKELGVSHPTVSKSLRKLQREGLVEVQPYRSILLTAKGERLASICQKRHKVVLGFLLALGLDQLTAENDAEGIEHHVSPKTLEAMKRFSKRI